LFECLFNEAKFHAPQILLICNQDIRAILKVNVAKQPATLYPLGNFSIVLSDMKKETSHS